LDTEVWIGKEMFMPTKILLSAILVLTLFAQSCATVGNYELTPERIANPGSLLIGKWEGDIWKLLARRNSLSRDSAERTLIIESVSNDKFYGRYGITGEKLGRMTGSVLSENGHLSIRFVTSWGAEVTLGLVSPDHMKGNFLQVLDDGRNFPMELTKKE
jgi:hypothetical protein